MQQFLKNYLETAKNALIPALPGVAMASPLIGGFTNFAMNFTHHPLAAALTGAWQAPLLVAAAYGVYAVHQNGGIQQTWEDIKKIRPADVINFLNPKNLLPKLGNALKTGYKSMMSLLPAGLGTTAAAFGAVTLTPGVAFSTSLEAASILFMPHLLVPAIGLTLAGFAIGHYVGSRIASFATRTEVSPLFDTLPGDTFKQKAASLLGRLMPYDLPGESIPQRHPLSALAIAGGVILGGILAAGFEFAVLPLAMAGAFAGAALTQPLQEKLVETARMEKAGLTQDVEPEAPVGLSPANEPAPVAQPASAFRLNNGTLTDIFGNTYGSKVPANQQQSAPAAAAQLKRTA